jgi:hypothetical protein
MSLEIVINVIIAVMASVAGGAGIYAAVRSDLTRAIVTAERAEHDAREAHIRINTHIEGHHERRHG